jgi:hypothetical protein
MVNVPTARRRRSRNALSGEQLAAMKNQIARATSTLRDGGVRVDPDLLSEDEQRELRDLVREASEGGWTLDKLDKKQQRRFEQLVERGAGDDGIFERARQDSEIRALARSALREAVRRPITRREERGLLAELGRQIRGGYLNVDHAAAVVVLLIAFESGETFGPKQRFEGTGADAVLVIDANWGFASERHDPGGVFAGWKKLVDHAAKNAWFVVGKAGPEWRISLGARALRVMGAAPTKRAA